MTRPSVRAEEFSGGEHWVVRDRAGAWVGCASPTRAGWESAVQRAVKVAEAQLTLSLPPVAPSVQRSITDVGLGVLNRTGRAVIEWFPPGKALWMLTRYADAAKFEAGKSPLYCYVVEGVDPRTEMT